MQEGSPTFSIVIPTYARSMQLAECLNSLAALTYPHDRFEVIVVDDGGEMPLTAIVDRFARELDLTLITQARAGPAAARNTGVARAKGNFLAFTDDDCQPQPDWLQKLGARLEATPARLIGGRTLNGLSDNPYSAASQFILDSVYSYYNSGAGGARFFASNNLAMPVEGFHTLGGFDPSFRTSEDRDLCDRWLQHGYRMTYAPEAIVYHSHQLTLRNFWRQHFNYGRGAFRFHQMRARRGAGHLRPDLKFYMSLLHASFLKEYRQIRLFPILALWQVANITGFLWEMTRGRKASERLLTAA